MDKIEAENQIAEIVFKYRLKGSMSDNRIAKIIIDNVMDEYAQQVSRGQVIKMLEFLYESSVENIPDELLEAIGDKNYELIYKIYYQNQQ